MQHPVYLIVAVDKNMGIGKDGRLPWHFSVEMKYFKELTSKTKDMSNLNMVIMGRNTWESLPEKYRPLPGRKNIVLTANHHYEVVGGAEICASLEEALSTADEDIEQIFIIGGAKVFESALSNPHVKGIYLTKINENYDCDTFFPDMPKYFGPKILIHSEEENSIKLEYYLYKRD
ncbi:dihydrofolate reductase [Candidatus Peregrinibacteria bacterium]|nr:dihydrofolate reductase [Candidatus Peregrinibacteria bacterium]